MGEGGREIGGLTGFVGSCDYLFWILTRESKGEGWFEDDES